jgi:hypothetical protein
MPLTVTEKEHWKDRISNRIEKRIEQLQAAEPNLKDRVDREARQRALQSLGLAEMQADLDRIEREKKLLEKKEKQTHRRMLAHVRGVPVEDFADNYFGCHTSEEVRTAVSRRQKVHEDELLAECDTGREILRLREEKENLLDTIWLATSPSQLKTLWTKVSELLSAEPTQLERHALAIPALDASGD